eukprot:5983081-Pyramimonas_sp.AAC.1
MRGGRAPARHEARLLHVSHVVAEGAGAPEGRGPQICVEAAPRGWAAILSHAALRRPLRMVSSTRTRCGARATSAGMRPAER